MPGHSLDQHNAGDDGERRGLQQDDRDGDPKWGGHGRDLRRIAVVGVPASHDSDHTRG